MRILPYESAPVKVRVEVETRKLRFFPVRRSKGRTRPGCIGGQTAESPAAKWAVDDANATGKGRRIVKFYAKSPTGLTDTDL
jgi:hypothetical protein